jgi:hypothetical protein
MPFLRVVVGVAGSELAFFLSATRIKVPVLISFPLRHIAVSDFVLNWGCVWYHQPN